MALHLMAVKLMSYANFVGVFLKHKPPNRNKSKLRKKHSLRLIVTSHAFILKVSELAV